uniref:Uncharacterized protein TCIL3000_11_8160 n=1 Tax=Trypanosoma congolense (strain IL3000) TaxID=1068625 RepID=G0V145_TRYCI|nr:unnamed protein product [Trypanosoma congolense IL3000]
MRILITTTNRDPIHTNSPHALRSKSVPHPSNRYHVPLTPKCCLAHGLASLTTEFHQTHSMVWFGVLPSLHSITLSLKQTPSPSPGTPTIPRSLFLFLYCKTVTLPSHLHSLRYINNAVYKGREKVNKEKRMYVNKKKYAYLHSYIHYNFSLPPAPFSR